MINNLKVLLIKNNSIAYDVTDIIGDFSIRNSTDTVGAEFNFSVARNIDDKHMKNTDIIREQDKIIIFNNNKEIFRGLIVTADIKQYNISFTSFDFGWGMNKNKIIIQAKKSTGKELIENVCKKANLPIGYISDIKTVITKIYKDNTVVDIVKDAIDQDTAATNKKYFVSVENGKLFVRNRKECEFVKGFFQQTKNVDAANVIYNIGSATHSKSIQDRFNSITVVSNDEKSTRVIANTKDSASIGLIGQLNEIISVDQKDESKALQIAKTKLAELNKVNEEFNLDSLLGDLNVCCGKCIEVDNDQYKLYGKFFIKESTHTYKNGNLLMSLTLERW